MIESLVMVLAGGALAMGGYWLGARTAIRARSSIRTLNPPPAMPEINARERFEQMLGRKPSSRKTEDILEGKPKDESKRWSASSVPGGGAPPVGVANSVRARDKGLRDGTDAESTAQSTAG